MFKCINDVGRRAVGSVYHQGMVRIYQYILYLSYLFVDDDSEQTTDLEYDILFSKFLEMSEDMKLSASQISDIMSKQDSYFEGSVHIAEGLCKICDKYESDELVDEASRNLPSVSVLHSYLQTMTGILEFSR